MPLKNDERNKKKKVGFLKAKQSDRQTEARTERRLTEAIPVPKS